MISIRKAKLAHSNRCYKSTFACPSSQLVLRRLLSLIGSSVLRGTNGHLAWFYASPLLVLAGCVLTGIAFMVSLVHGYENYQHGNPHTAKYYALNETLGFGSLGLFVIGYIWLIVVATR